ncbi:MAG: SPFH domain-containing protein [Planctomycetota bacterium]|jgi:membrane protease subunit HflC|nr:SPFH domain-containing protein [Planctomycetota bacterium]
MTDFDPFKTPSGGSGGSPPPRPTRPTTPQFSGKLPGGRGIILAVVGFIMLVGLGAVFVTGRGGIVEVRDTEVAVVVNYLSGESELVAMPGYRVFMPFFSQAFVFDKSPNKFVMEGEKDRDSNHVSKLTVRANDGSNFWFETLEIQYQLIIAQAPTVLYDSGPGDAFKSHWVRTFARSVLRDEFGRFSAEEVADPSSYSVATQRSTERLNDLLEPHGVKVIQIITPKPKFETAYEDAIEERKVANQEVERLKIEAEQLVLERERRLANIDRDKATDYEQLLGQLEAERIAAEKERLELEKSADAYYISQVAEGKASLQRMAQQATAKEAEARKEAEGLNAKVNSLAKQGDILVREAIAKKLNQIRFEIIPYRRDPAPTRIEHLGAVPATGGKR